MPAHQPKASFRNVLGLFEKQWALVAWDAIQSQGSIAVGHEAPVDDRFFSASTYHKGLVIDSLDGTRLFPILRFGGYQIRPMAWHPTSTSPLLRCRLIPIRQWATQPMMSGEELAHAGWTRVDQITLEKFIDVEQCGSLENSEDWSSGQPPTK